MTEEVTIQEHYATAISATNLRVEADRSGSGDVLIAAGWSKSYLGKALMRLQSEYDSVQKPKKIEHDVMVSLALKHKAKNQKATPAQCEKAAKDEVAQWGYTEKHLFLGRLKSLPFAVECLAVQAARWQIAEPVRISTAIIGYWLDSVCNACHGVKFELIPNTPSASSKGCASCQGAGVAGTPFGANGRRLANYMDECREAAADTIKASLRGRHKLQKVCG